MFRILQYKFTYRYNSQKNQEVKQYLHLGEKFKDTTSPSRLKSDSLLYIKYKLRFCYMRFITTTYKFLFR